MHEEHREQIARLKKHKHNLREPLERLRETEKDTRPSGADKQRGFWDIYDTGARGPNGYFRRPDIRGGTFRSLMPFDAVKERIEERKRDGKKTVVLDVMGQGRIGEDLGADISVGWTLKSHGEPPPGRKIVEGNIFEENELQKQFKSLDAYLADPTFELDEVFFRPVAGFGMYADNDYALAYLYDRVLRPLYDRLADGGHLFMAINFGSPERQPANVMTSLREEGFDVRGPKGDSFVITKRANAGSLPSLRTLATKHGLQVSEAARRLHHRAEVRSQIIRPDDDGKHPFPE